MRSLRFASLLLAATLAAGACSPLFSDDAGDPLRVGYVTRTGDQVRGTGSVEWIAEQGGSLAIRGDDGRLYEPVEVPAELARAGTRVRFAARVSEDRGPLARVELVGIARE